MRAYFDTSFIVPLFLPEPQSERIEAHIRGLPETTELTVSQWTMVELASVFSRLVRMRELERPLAKTILRTATSVIGESFDIITPIGHDYERCRNFLGGFDNSLRAGDALHLAIAANHESDIIFSLDRGMLSAGAALGLNLSDGS